MLVKKIGTMLAPYPRIFKPLRSLKRRLFGLKRVDSGSFWENRYANGGNSGAGSYGRLAQYKASVINDLVAKEGIPSILEWGCGDGHQLTLAEYPSYIGLDVSRRSIEMCKEGFAGRNEFTFLHVDEYAGQTADLSLSLDVIYHLVEDNVFNQYMERLFDSSNRYVLIYSSNEVGTYPEGSHVRHRVFTDWIAKFKPGWKLLQKMDNPYPFDENDQDHTSIADFFLFSKAA